jgi:hypothetical protein
VSLRARFALLVFAVATVSSPQAAADESHARAEITLMGDAQACATVKEVVTELLVRDRVSVVWITRTQFQPRDIFDRRVTWGVAAWIDLSAASEARLYFRDAGADRFFIRPLPLARGIDEIAKEEIAHIVSNAVRALSQGSGESLTRSEAREALHLQPAAEEETPPVPPEVPMRFSLSALAGAGVFASDLPWVGKGTLSLAISRGPRWNRAESSFGAWLDLGYQMPGHYRGGSVGADVQAVSARLGVLWETGRTLLLRIGLGAGADRVHYQPQGDGDHVALAAASSFTVPVLSLWVGMDVRLLDWLALTSRISVDAALAKVHFDLNDSNGKSTRVLVPYPVLPAALLGLALVL